MQLDGHGALADVIRALDRENLRAAEINLHQPSLDDVFLAKTGQTLEGSDRRMNVFVAQVWLIARRSVVRNARQPGTWIPPLTFPLILMAVNSNGLRAATHLPGFPTKSFLAFFMPFSFMQGALFASGIAGVDFARDIDTGFLNRLALTPVRGSCAAARPDRRRARHRRRSRPSSTSASGSPPGCTSTPASAAPS